MTKITGSRWWKFDFHTHTPFSTDTAWAPLIGSDDELTPEAWLHKFMEAKIDCVAVTDHNGGGWIDRLKSEYEKLENSRPEWFRKLVLFPGVEISVNGGFHMLGIFDPSETTATIDSLLGEVKFRGTKGDPEERTELSCEAVARAIVDSGGICIPAHIDIENGIFQTDATGKLIGDAPTTRRLMETGLIEAVEVRDCKWTGPGLFQDLNLNLPHLLATDCHNFRGARTPGDHFTWIKMGKPSLDGLRLALIDGNPLSVLRGDEVTSDPNRKPAMVIESVTVDKLRLMGRRTPETAPMSPWLTTLIGGRGSGKSTIIDCIRIGLDRIGDLPQELRDDFNDFDRVALSRRERGAMLEDSQITIRIKKETGHYRLQWSQLNREIQIHARQPDGSWKAADGVVRQRFPVRMMSQKEIFAIARNPQSLLDLVDASPELELNSWREKKKQLETKFRRLMSEKRELVARTATKPRLKGELEEILARILLFEKGGNRETLRQYQVCRRQTRELDTRTEELDGVAETLEGILDASGPADSDESVFDAGDPADKSALDLIRESYAKQASVVSQLEAIIKDLNEFNTKWRASLDKSDWQQKNAQVESAYLALTKELEQAGIADPKQYASLVQRRQQIERELGDIAASEKKIVEIDSQWREVVEQLADHRCELSRRREDFLNRVLRDNAYVRVRVQPLGNNDRDCEAGYRAVVLRPDKMERDILDDDGKKGILAGLYDDLSSESEMRRGTLIERIMAIKKMTAQMAASGVAAEKCTKWFAKHLNKLAPEDLDGLWTWFPDDVLLVDYRRDVKKDEWSPIEQGSPGQQTAAILAFILSHGDEPIILDQPEDDLDNHLIYDLIVRQIRESKRDRQIIIATHNPNIVVNGDAEMVLAMDVVSTQCVVHQQNSGCLQERAVREEVCKVMEGGRDAFLKRYRRIVQPKGPSEK
ncbi:TrlF family AAA-like ATPase [Rhodopirellula sp. P2]|uniref:TrlF family AAA-like ATPase n=1 Tax=Rhodopirellula sp. P2 TaxID=2127060 RepID=UPI002367D482|nr:hypothetical protein [Rhodopirellula sp. P2]WDQ14570.1 hypothetical protein PSR62_13035 [Rhodopirellula sp. P2]